MSDGVIHCAFIHDFSKFKENCEIDQHAIEALGSALAGSDRPLIVSSGIGPLAPGRLATEDDDPRAHSAIPAFPSSLCYGAALAGRKSGGGAPSSDPQHRQAGPHHPSGRSREKGVSAYLGDRRNGWAAAHVIDTARLYRLALEKPEAGAKYHAVGEEGVQLRDIAEVIGRGLKVPVVAMSPEEAPAHFGWFAMFVGLDMPASSAQTQQRLGWHPTGPGLIADLERMRCFES